MTISVIIPVYQAARFLTKAVESACEQEEVSEILLIEDGSTDNSLKLCKTLEQQLQPRVRLLRHADLKNHGAGASRNLGITKAKGHYIAFLDADDYYLPGRFKHDLEILDTNPEIDGVYNALGVNIYDDEEQQRVKQFLTTVKYFIPPEELFEEMDPVGTSGYFHCDTLTVRRGVFDQVGVFDVKLELSQDTHMLFKMAEKLSLVAGVIDKPVAIRGVHTGNRVKDSEKLTYYRFLVFISLLEWGKTNKLSEQRMRLLWNSLYNVYGKPGYSQNLTIPGIKLRAFYYYIRNSSEFSSQKLENSKLSVFTRLLKL